MNRTTMGDRLLPDITLALMLLVFSSVVLGQKAFVSREPFVLEFPGISGIRFTKPTVRLSSLDLPSLKFHILEPFADKIKYGDIIVTLNGDGINTQCRKSRDAEGKVVLCLRRVAGRLGGYEPAAGKNILEIKATDDQGNEYYASYIIILGDKNAGGDSLNWINGKADRKCPARRAQFLIAANNIF